MADIQYNDRDLQKLFAEMEPKHRLKAIKGAFRKEANKVRRTAINNLRGSIRSDRDLERGVRAIVYKKAAGFRITVGTKKATAKNKKAYGFHKNRQGLSKPVLIWAEDGTEQRKTKTATKVYIRSRKGHSTGRMKRYGFIRKTRDEMADKVTADIHTEVINNVQSVAKKYGCI